MKRLFQAMVLLSMATIIGCSDDEDGVEVHAIAVTPESVELATGAQSFTVKVEHDGEVEISIPGDAQWLSGGGKTLAVSADTCTFSVTANDEVEARSAIITFTDKDYNLSDTLRVTQSGTAPEIAVSNPKVELAAADTTFTVEVKHNVEVEVAISEEAAWLTQVEPETRAMTTNTYTFHAAENPDTTARKATITFANTANGLSQTVEVTQEGRELEDITVNIPDEKFQAYCLYMFDKNDDDIITANEVADVTSIEITKVSMKSMEGIEYFTSLAYLNCEHNSLTDLDLSHNVKLKTLKCSFNDLTSLNVSGCTELSGIWCQSNELTSLDLNTNTALTGLHCSTNKLNSLDVSNNTKLDTLECYENQLTDLDLSKNTELTRLFCSDNLLTNLDLGKNTNLYYLECGSNQLTNLDLSTNTKLGDLTCCKNQIESLDLSKNTELVRLFCFNNNLKSLFISNLEKLEYVHCYSNNLTSLDVSGCTVLSGLNCYANQLESLDISQTGLGESSSSHPLDCAPMDDESGENTLETLTLKNGWSINGITGDKRSDDYIPAGTNIMEVD